MGINLSTMCRHQHGRGLWWQAPPSRSSSARGGDGRFRSRPSLPCRASRPARHVRPVRGAGGVAWGPARRLCRAVHRRRGGRAGHGRALRHPSRAVPPLGTATNAFRLRPRGSATNTHVELRYGGGTLAPPTPADHPKDLFNRRRPSAQVTPTWRIVVRGDHRTQLLAVQGDHQPDRRDGHRPRRPTVLLGGSGERDPAVVQLGHRQRRHRVVVMNSDGSRWWRRRAQWAKSRRCSASESARPSGAAWSRCSVWDS